jgi:hypothetical protein
MSTHVSWLLEDRIIFNQMVGAMTKEEMPAFNDQMLSYFDQSTQPVVHNLVDMRYMDSFPSVIQIQKHFTFPSHPKMGWGVFVGISNPVARMTLAIGPQMFKLHFRHVKTIEEALDLFKFIDRTLPDLMPYADRIPNYATDK